MRQVEAVARSSRTGETSQGEDLSALYAKARGGGGL